MTAFNYNFMPLPKGGQLMLCSLPRSEESFATIKKNATLLLSLTETLPRIKDEKFVDDGLFMHVDGLDIVHFPVADYHLPTKYILDKWRKFAPIIHARLAKGETIAIHCYAGLGRTGTWAAMILIEQGMIAREAIDTVRSYRQGAIETSGQESFLMKYYALNP